jgi:ABC-2 type transport system permease protein
MMFDSKEFKASFRRNYKTVLARAYVRIVGVNREPSWLAFDVILPLFTVAAFVFVYLATLPLQAANPLIIRVIIGGAMTAFWLNVLWGMGATFYFEKEMGNLETYLMAPISRMSLMLGMAIGGMFNTTIRAIATIFLGAFIFGVSFTVSSPIGLTLIFILTMIALYGLGMLFTSLFLLYGREAWHTTNLLEEPIYFLSGFYYPVKFLGFWASLAASILPITVGLDAMNQILVPSAQWGFLPVEIEILLLFFLAIFFLLAARWSLRRMEYIAKRDGKLTLRWQ